jgi:hypothetical protein
MSMRIRYLGTTLALLAIGLGYAFFQQWPRHQTPRLPARAEASARPASFPAAPPTAREILDRASDLALTPEQRARLAGLDTRWRDEILGLEAAVRVAEQEFGKFVRETQQGGKTSLQEIQRRSEDYRNLSAELRERSRLHAKAAAHILTDSQQRTLTLLTSPETQGGVR